MEMCRSLDGIKKTSKMKCFAWLIYQLAFCQLPVFEGWWLIWRNDISEISKIYE